MLLFLMSIYSFDIGRRPCSRRPQSPDYDGVMLLNVMHSNQPLTVFDTSFPERISLPVMLSEFSKEMMENQVFDLRYESSSRRVWLELRKERCIEIADVHSSLKGVRVKISPSSVYLKRFPDSAKFQLISEDKCLTVGPETSYAGVAGWKLLFSTCKPDADDQKFVMIPSLKGLLKLHKGARTHGMIHRMHKTFRRIRKIINVVDLGRSTWAFY